VARSIAATGSIDAAGNPVVWPAAANYHYGWTIAAYAALVQG